jgi:hypothetical protein
MNYLIEIKAFYDRLEVKPLSSSAIALWHALLHINNKIGWAEEFSVPVTVLSLKSGLSERSVSNARNELKTKGYIDFKSRSGNRSAVYKLKSLSANFADKLSDTVSDSLSDFTSDSVSGSPSALNKQNKTKPKKEKSVPFSSQVQEVWDHYVATFDGFFPRGLTLTKERRNKIEARLKEGRSVEDIKLAIDHIRQSPFHCGENPQSKFYADITLICRNASKVEEWMNYQPKRTSPTTEKRQKVFDMQTAITRFTSAGFDPEIHKDFLKEWLSRGADPRELYANRATRH